MMSRHGQTPGPRSADPHPSLSLQRRRRLLVLALSLLLIPGLACGNVLSRPDPTVAFPTPVAQATSTSALASTTPTPSRYPTRTPTPTPTVPTSTPTPLPPEALSPAVPARVLARRGLNVREAANSGAKQLGRLAPGALVTVLEGPVETDGYRWWRIENGQGLSGWAADGDGENVWLTGDIGEPRPVNRAVRLGDRVTVTTKGDRHLALRYDAGGTLIRRVPAGTQFSVEDGPVDVEGFRWWLLVDETGAEGWAAEGDRETRWLSPLE